MSELETVRRFLSRHLVGRGVELGPGHQPFPIVLAGTEVSYVDRWEPDENRSLFPELGEMAPFPRPDIVSNLDVDRLKPLDDGSQDFVIASHILEHLANPLRILDEIHRVLRPGGTALILLPDRRRTFDAGRPPTPLDHLVAEYEADTTEVDDDHIVDFIRLTNTDDYDAFERMSDADRQQRIEWHRRRSIHVHCWVVEEFLDVLLYATESLGHQWEFVDGVLSDDEGPDGIEFGYVLRRSQFADLSPAERRRRFEDTWNLWLAHRGLAADLAAATPVDAVPVSSPSGLPRRLAGRIKRAVVG